MLRSAINRNILITIIHFSIFPTKKDLISPILTRPLPRASFYVCKRKSLDEQTFSEWQKVGEGEDVRRRGAGPASHRHVGLQKKKERKILGTLVCESVRMLFIAKHSGGGGAAPPSLNVALHPSYR